MEKELEYLHLDLVSVVLGGEKTSECACQTIDEEFRLVSSSNVEVMVH